MPKTYPMFQVAATGDVQGGRQRSPHMTQGKLVPYLRVANVFDGYIDFSDINTMAFKPQEIERFRLFQGDILLNEGQSIELVGRCAMFVESQEDYCFQNTLIRYRAGPNTYPRFALQLFRYCQSTGIFSKIAVKTNSIAHLGVSRFAELELPFPPYPEQLEIAKVLDVWDSAIEKTEQLIAAKLRRNQVLSNQLLFGHVRFRQGNTKTTRSLHWFSAPSDWQVVEIGKVAREISMLNGNDDDLPILSCTKHDGLVDSLKYFDKKVFSHDTSKSKIVLRGQFAYATNHIEEGSIGYQDLVPAGLVSPIYTVFQTNAKKIDDGYLYKLLKTEKLRQIFSANTNASVDRRGSLRWKDFARIHVPLPPLDEQREINAVLDDAKREIVLLQAQVKALKTQKRGLMQKLLTGQWRVKAAKTEAG